MIDKHYDKHGMPEGDLLKAPEFDKIQEALKAAALGQSAAPDLTMLQNLVQEAGGREELAKQLQELSRRQLDRDRKLSEL
mmetsp:Transcript_87772/g.237756  ORF Transcript_87772/g.237756 Transcript_87772/m.237756 type:complete len:80 (-) Transcript_87772:23-262(-)